jgi:hypothetical protein
MSRLLSLPRELRDRILEFAITHYEDAPKSPAEAGERISLHDIEYFAPTGGLYVKYAADIPSTSPFSLLLSNHQLRTETLEAMRRVPLTTECDVLIANDKELLVTWTYVPPIFSPHPTLPHIIQTVSPTGGDMFQTTFNIRSHGVFIPTATCSRSGYEDLLEGPNNDIAGPGTVISAFCALFERFLRCGPSAMPPRSSPTQYDRKTHIPLAHLNIITPSAPLLPETLGPHYARTYRADTLESQAMVHPKALLEMLTNWFWVSDLLDERSEGPLHLGQLLARVGELRYGIDGAVMCRMSNEGLDGNWESEGPGERRNDIMGI